MPSFDLDPELRAQKIPRAAPPPPQGTLPAQPHAIQPGGVGAAPVLIPAARAAPPTHPSLLEGRRNQPSLATVLPPTPSGDVDDLPTATPRREPPSRRQVSSRGAAAVEHFEGWRDHPYNDSEGNATIGYGHLLHHGPVTSTDIAKWGHIPRSEGKRLLLADMAEAIRAVKRSVKVPLTQGQFDALVSFTFNIGPAGLAESQALQDLNLGHYGKVPSDFLHWDHDSRGNVVPGLYRRRREEGEMFAHGRYPGGN